MRNTLIVFGFVVIVVILAFFIKSKRDADVPSLGTSNAETSAPADSINLPIKSGGEKSSNTSVKPSTPLVTNLFPQKGSYECKYEQATQTGRSSNTVYIANGKMRGEFRSLDSQGFGTLNMMVYDGVYLYTWIEGKATGVRTQPKSVSEIPAVFPTDIHEGKVLGSGINNVSWECHAWATVSSMLSKPTYVKFN